MANVERTNVFVTNRKIFVPKRIGRFSSSDLPQNRDTRKLCLGSRGPPLLAPFSFSPRRFCQLPPQTSPIGEAAPPRWKPQVESESEIRIGNVYSVRRRAGTPPAKSIAGRCRGGHRNNYAMIQHKPQRRSRDTPKDILERTAAAPTTSHGANDQSRRQRPVTAPTTSHGANDQSRRQRPVTAPTTSHGANDQSRRQRPVTAPTTSHGANDQSRRQRPVTAPTTSHGANDQSRRRRPVTAPTTSHGANDQSRRQRPVTAPTTSHGANDQSRRQRPVTAPTTSHGADDQSRRQRPVTAPTTSHGANDQSRRQRPVTAPIQIPAAAQPARGAELTKTTIWHGWLHGCMGRGTQVGTGGRWGWWGWRREGGVALL